MPPLSQPTSRPLTDVPVERQVAVPAPRSLTEAVWRVVRLDIALALATPALYAGLLGGTGAGQLNGLNLFFVLLSVLGCSLAFTAFSAFRDYRQTFARGARPVTEVSNTGFGLMVAEMIPPAMAVNIGLLALSISIVATLWLALLAGWPIFFFCGLSLLVLAASLLPPAKLAYRFPGVGELGVMLAFGILIPLGSYFAQTGQLNWFPAVASIPLILLLGQVAHAENLAEWRRDWAVGKHTLAVQLGPKRALDLSVLLTIVAYAAIILTAVVTRTSLWTLIGLLPLPVAMGAYANLNGEKLSSEEGFRLSRATAIATFWTGLLLALAVWISQ